MTKQITTKDKQGNPLFINITTEKGYFSITGTLYTKGKPKTDEYLIAGGCIHETILEARPDLKLLVDLHLSTLTGYPLYAIGNGSYWLKEDFEKGIKYLRIPEDIKENFRDVKTPEQLARKLRGENYDLFLMWENQAIEANMIINGL